jgi:membrane fusion protein (multidrug efflux system)
MRLVTRAATAVASLGVALSFAACGARAPGGAAPAPIAVKAIRVVPSTTITYADKVGEVRGSSEVELRARVTGVLLQTHFNDGALVESGQLLFSIDPREFKAQVANARARLASAEANLARAREDVARYQPLLADEAISRQVYDNAVAASRQATAEVDASRAALEQAELGLDYAAVRAPLRGRIGAAQVFPGGLVTAGQTLLATLSADDPAWVYFTISESELLDFERRNAGRTISPDDPVLSVQLLLSDGSVYPHRGRINFGDRALDATTGTYRLRAEFPNPDHRLLPGLFARVRATGRELTNALVIPDRAVQEQLGRYFVTVVGAGDKAELRPVELGPRFGNRQVIQSGLQANDRVVVEGIQKARPGATLTVKEARLEDFDRPAQTTGPATASDDGAATAAAATT